MSPKESGDVSWYSTSQNVATVDEKGYVTAVGEGTTSIVYKTAAGKEGKCTVTVNQPKSISLTGGIDPTFYTTDDEMNKFDKKGVFAYVIYSDGTARKVTPDSVGTVDLAKVGIQDIDIKYGELTGKLRICHNTDSYIPSVTEKASEQETPSESVSSTDNDKPSESVTDGAKETTDNKSFIKEFGLYIIIVAALVVVGIIIMFIEKKNADAEEVGAESIYDEEVYKSGISRNDVFMLSGLCQQGKCKRQRRRFSCNYRSRTWRKGRRCSPEWSYGKRN